MTVRAAPIAWGRGVRKFGATMRRKATADHQGAEGEQDARGRQSFPSEPGFGLPRGEHEFDEQDRYRDAVDDVVTHRPLAPDPVHTQRPAADEPRLEQVGVEHRLDEQPFLEDPVCARQQDDPPPAQSASTGQLADE